MRIEPRGWMMAVLVGVLAPVVMAQEAQFRQLETVAPQTSGGLSSHGIAPIVEDEEIGEQMLMKRKEKLPQFSVAGDAQYFFTSNALLTDHRIKDDFVFVGSAGASWNPTWIPDVTTSVFARQQFFRYDQNEKMDFNATSVGFNAGGSVCGLFNVSGGYSATWLDSRISENEFYREGDLNLCLSRSEKLGDRFRIPYGYTLDYFHTSPVDYNRLTHGFFAGLDCAITPKLLAQFLCRFQYEDYNSVNRADEAAILSLGLTYNFTDWASVRTYASWVTNDSSTQRDYDVITSGVGLNLTLRF